ncbi:MAG: hypothetical protein QW727_04435 [Candidatus Pacearchaeota archaeon]
MVVKKRGFETVFKGKISNRVLYTIIISFTIIFLGFLVYAASGGGSVPTNPVPNPGHALSELQKCNDGETIKMSGGSWACVRSSGGAGIPDDCPEGYYLKWEGDHWACDIPRLNNYVIGPRLYKNTAGCDLGYTRSTEAITTIGSCNPSSGGMCEGEYPYNGVTCRIYHGNREVCEAIDDCYWDSTQDGCYDRIQSSGISIGDSCGYFNGWGQSVCEGAANTCTWVPNQGGVNTPLGNLIIQLSSG